MPLGRKPRVRVDIKLPGVTIGTDDVQALFKRGTEAGPFLITSRACGLSLDTGFANDNGAAAILWPPHGRRHQLWYLQPSGHKGQTMVISADTGLALDATREKASGRGVLLWESHGAEWQRWRLEPSADGCGYLLACVADGRILTASDDAQRGWVPWLLDRDGSWSQQWLLCLPHGTGIA